MKVFEWEPEDPKGVIAGLWVGILSERLAAKRREAKRQATNAKAATEKKTRLRDAVLALPARKK
jgi:hypothetical protein